MTSHISGERLPIKVTIRRQEPKTTHPPLLSVILGPSRKLLIDALGRIDFSDAPPVYFKIAGMSAGMYLAVRSLTCVGEGGHDWVVTGWWLNRSFEDTREIVQMTYSTETRVGKITQLC